MALNLGSHVMSLTDRMRYQPVPQRIRCSLAGDPVCDTTSAALVWESRRVVPMYAVPEADLVASLHPGQGVPVPDRLPPILGPVNFALHVDEGETLDVHAGSRVAPAAAFRPADPDLSGMVVLEFAAFDWQEETLSVGGHPHDVFKRIDVLPSDRHVQVLFEGEVLADTTRPKALQETLIPTRWYVPREDVRLDLLESSDSRTQCAYKGHASYYSVSGGGEAGRDLAWTYPAPRHEAAAVKDHVCFYSERSDLVLDGEPVPRPRTPWSSPADQAAF